MPRYYARIGEQCFSDESVLMVNEDGTRDFVYMRSLKVLTEEHGTACNWTKELINIFLHEVFLFEPDLLVDEGL